MRAVAKRTCVGLLAVMASAVALLSVRYLLPDPLLPAPLMVSHLARWPWMVMVHVGGGVTALMLGVFQPVTRKGARRKWHRLAGRVYVLACLCSAVAGLWLALTTSAGPVASLGFGGLAVVWLFTTTMGWLRVVRGDLIGHRRWMIRSLSLTLAAVTLRIMIMAAAISGLPFEDAYRAISFLCWVPNLLIAELWLRSVRTQEAGPVGGSDGVSP